MALKLYNTLTKTKEEFHPFDPANVRMYVCGPTVYDFAHIGNARPLIVFDVLFRLLRHTYGEQNVTYVRNITDVDDKINARAAEEFPGLPLNEAIRRVTEKTAEQFFADTKALGCLEPTHQPRATEHIAGMIAMISELIAGGHAYAAEGHVLFHVPSMPDYGRLARRSLDEMKAGARVEVAPYKRDPTDFVLWKPSTPAEPGWDSPWGRGRPGWHIECSAMADAFLWEKVKATLSPNAHAHPHAFDIHGGGIDLVFPHHENEIAQSRCAHHTDTMAQIWMHNGFLQVEGEKMSKSLGNFVTIRELVGPNDVRGRRWRGDIVRLAMLRTHYRQPIDWTDRGMVEAQVMLTEFSHAALGGTRADARVSPEVVAALSDDINSPAAISALGRLAKRARSLNQNDNPTDATDELVGSLALLGFDETISRVPQENRELREDLEKAFEEGRAKSQGLDTGRVDSLIAARAAARARKDFKEADRIRAELDAMGILLEDAKDPATGAMTTTWKVKR
ncbi:MAG: cysteine--tRNA ligase [Bauldia sp.]